MSKDDQDKNKQKKDISIVEKLKFWEEQDRINSSLIPRVVKMHETITELSKTVSSYSNLYAKHESRIKSEFHDKLSESRALQKSLQEQSKTLTDLAIQSKDAIRKIDDFKTKALDFNIKYLNLVYDIAKKDYLLGIFRDGSSLPNSLLKSLSNEESKPSEITAKAT